MGVTTEPTYEDYEHLLGLNTYLSRKEERKIHRQIIELEIVSDFSLIAKRCHQLMPKQLPKNNPQLRNAIVAKTGERYTGHCIELWLWGKGYALNGLSTNSFTIEPQYYNNNRKIDFKIEIKTRNNTISIVIDAKNWARYSTKDVNYYMKSRHIPPFNSFIANYKLIFLNKRLIPKVKSILQSSSIEPIEVNEHLTDKQYIKDFFVLLLSMENSIKHLDNLISIPDVSKNISKLKTPDAIKYDIELGKPYKLIERKWEIGRSYIDNLKNQMKTAGMILPNRNTEVFTRLDQYNDFFKRS